MKSGKYIYQRPGWPTFRYDPATLQPALSDVCHQQGRLLGRLEALARSSRDGAELEALTDEVVETSSIEGEYLDRAQVRSSAARKLRIKAKGLVPSGRDVDGVVAMMVDAIKKHPAPLTDERLFDWHRLLFPEARSGRETLTAGAWRTDRDGPMQVVSGQPGREKVHFRAPPATRVQEEMQRFLLWFESGREIDPILKAGLAHLWFVTIHPFDDGNGRIARAITELALARAEKSSRRYYSMSAQIRTERSVYYDMLEHTQKGDLDVSAWLDWFIGCLGRSIARASGDHTRLVAIARFRERAGGHPLNPRQHKVLERMLDDFEGPMTSGKWVKIGKCSQDTATRDLQQLVEWGLLEKGSAGGRSTHYELVRATERS